MRIPLDLLEKKFPWQFDSPAPYILKAKPIAMPCNDGQPLTNSSGTQNVDTKFVEAGRALTNLNEGRQKSRLRRQFPTNFHKAGALS